jgi:hypothetical protein
VDEETQRRDLAALAELIRTGAASKPRPIDQQRADLLLGEVVAGLRSTYGDEAVDTLAAPRAAGADPKVVCDITAGLYASVLRLPPDDAAVVLRALFAGA